MSKSEDYNKTKSSLSDKLNKEYKVVVLDQETLSQSATYKGSLMKFLVWVLLIMLLASILTTLFISYTPVRRLVPGYGDIEENKKYLELKKKMTELEAGVEVQQTYIEGLQKLFAGELDKKNLPETLTDPVISNTEKAVEVVSESDRKISDSTRGLSKAFFIAPVNGSISSGFDRSISHFGVDVLAAKGTAVKSVSPGVVISSDWTIDSGNTISIQHTNNTISVYKHNSSLLKATGEIVRSGEAIAIIGNTGTLSDGPHLHFELWYDGTPVDPEQYITF